MFLHHLYIVVVSRIISVSVFRCNRWDIFATYQQWPSLMRKPVMPRGPLLRTTPADRQVCDAAGNFLDRNRFLRKSERRYRYSAVSAVYGAPLENDPLGTARMLPELTACFFAGKNFAAPLSDASDDPDGQEMYRKRDYRCVTTYTSMCF